MGIKTNGKTGYIDKGTADGITDKGTDDLISDDWEGIQVLEIQLPKAFHYDINGPNALQ